MRHELTDKPREVRCIPADIDPELLNQDLPVFRQTAVDAGAADSAVISSRDIIFSPEVTARVAADNRFPSVHWPLDYPVDDLAEALCAYDKGIFFRMGRIPGMPAYGGGPIRDESHRRLYQQTYEIITLIESAAFYLGYHLAMGLAAGNCRGIFCAEEKRCRPMIKGQTCIHGNIGRPSMEAAGIDARAMSAALKWETAAAPDGFEIGGLVMIT